MRTKGSWLLSVPISKRFGVENLKSIFGTNPPKLGHKSPLLFVRPPPNLFRIQPNHQCFERLFCICCMPLIVRTAHLSEAERKCDVNLFFAFNYFMRHSIHGVAKLLLGIKPRHVTSVDRCRRRCFEKLEQLLDPRNREWCLRQASKSNFGLMQAYMPRPLTSWHPKPIVSCPCPKIGSRL